MNKQPNVYTVQQLNSYVKNMFTQDYLLQSLFVKGEVSNCKYHSSGHIYFTLKDASGTLKCVMFASDRARMTFRMTEGQSVIVGGSVSVYERDGVYQLYAKQILLDGAGALYERYEQLKRELAEEGMFAAEYKQRIPKYPRTIGVVTARTGAAVHDIMQIAARRNPYVQLVLYPAIVQGAAAAPSIVAGIHALEAYGVDVMIVGRGGGSIEDLWGFNEREVAQAVFDCSVPIISAVGHETDTTIIDYVADLRAPTPSAAAELAVPDIRELMDGMDALHEALDSRMHRVLFAKRQQAIRMGNSLSHLSPAGRIRERRERSMHLEERLRDRMEMVLKDRRASLALYIERMRALSPLEKLNSGYSYAEDTQGRNIRSITQVQPGERMTLHVTDGIIETVVERVLEGE